MIPDKVDPSLLDVVETRYGRMLVLTNDRYMGSAFVRYGEYSEAEVALWRQFLPDDAVCCDVGANIGAHTVALARLCPKGVVFAWEPLPTLYRMLVANVALNGLTHVSPIHAALGDSTGVTKVPGIDYTKADNYGGLALGQYDTGLTVPVHRLDQYPLPRLDFLKADVEGMEAAVLRGAEQTIARHRPILYVEANPEAGHPNTEGPNQLALAGQLQALGYRCWWHLAGLYNPENRRGAAPADGLEGQASFNILALPVEAETEVTDLPLIPEQSPGGVP